VMDFTHDRFAVDPSQTRQFPDVLRNHAEIVRAHANRESPKPAARPFPVGAHSLGRCRHGGLPPSGDGALKTVLKA
jgi:hypothetical protein